MGVYYTVDGSEWSPLGQGMPNVPVNDMKIHPTENYLAAATHARGIYKIDLNQITEIEKSTELPEEFVLYQNYPNPFNPSTKIKYHLKRSGIVELIVYNSLGEKIRTLVSKHQSKGNYEVTFNAENLSSGIYFYSLNIDEYSETKRMSLVK